MKTIAELAKEIVAREGGFVDDSDDPGGATNYGVTIHTMRRLGLDLTGDGTTDTADLRALSQAQAVEIFIEHYYRRPGLQALPVSIQASVFDMQVNAGSNAVRILQRLLRDMGHDIAVDGKVGPLTIRAAQIARRNYYYALADRRPASRKFARRRDGAKGGWILRAEEFIAPRYHLTDAEHRARTAGWL